MSRTVLGKMLKTPFIGLILLYQWTIGLLIGPRCRFYPSCSNYALESLKEHSLPKALFFIGKRLLKCHPFHPGGCDPVPKRKRN